MRVRRSEPAHCAPGACGGRLRGLPRRMRRIRPPPAASPSGSSSSGTGRKASASRTSAARPSLRPAGDPGGDHPHAGGVAAGRRRRQRRPSERHAQRVLGGDAGRHHGHHVSRARWSSRTRSPPRTSPPTWRACARLNPDVVIQWSDAQLIEPLENAGLTGARAEEHRQAGGRGRLGRPCSPPCWASRSGPRRSRHAATGNSPRSRRWRPARQCRGPEHPVLQPIHRRAQGRRREHLQRLLHQAGGRNQPRHRPGPAARHRDGGPGRGAGPAAGTPRSSCWATSTPPCPRTSTRTRCGRTSPLSARGASTRCRSAGTAGIRPGRNRRSCGTGSSDIAFPQQRSGLRGKATEYFRFLYNHEPTAGELDKISGPRQNGESANYRQFNAG